MQWEELGPYGVCFFNYHLAQPFKLSSRQKMDQHTTLGILALNQLMWHCWYMFGADSTLVLIPALQSDKGHDNQLFR